jgi:L-arabinose transport system ATP-binding protein
MGDELLRFEGVEKGFPGVRALAGVTFGVRAGEVHALLGENGAGKSTLLKILSGVYRPEAGRVVVAGEERRFGSTVEALAAGVAVIYQELHLVPQLSVAENLFLGHLPTAGGVIRRGELLERAAAQLRAVGETMDPRTLVGKLPIGQRQMIEIAKALTRGARILAFDEPTSSLSVREIGKLFEVIGELRRGGAAILYVTHRMEEVFAICDSGTVLRDGKHVVTHERLAGVTHEQIVKAMVGRDIADIYGYRERQREAGKKALEVSGMEGRGLRAPANLCVGAGEIVGVFGLVGAGRTELLRLIYGAEPKRAGAVKVEGREVRIRSPRDGIRAGVVLAPEDRKREGIVPLGSVLENINLSARRREALGGIVIRPGWERANAERRVKELGVNTPGVWQQIRNLSGGNQQKVILGRWLSEKVQVMLLDEPTRGIDVGAKSEIYSLLYRLAEAGVGVLFVSSDLPEVLGVADRVVVMREGRISGEFPRMDATAERVMAAALPVKEEDAVENGRAA